MAVASAATWESAKRDHPPRLASGGGHVGGCGGRWRSLKLHDSGAVLAGGDRWGRAGQAGGAACRRAAHVRRHDYERQRRDSAPAGRRGGHAAHQCGLAGHRGLWRMDVRAAASRFSLAAGLALVWELQGCRRRPGSELQRAVIAAEARGAGRRLSLAGSPRFTRLKIRIGLVSSFLRSCSNTLVGAMGHRGRRQSRDGLDSGRRSQADRRPPHDRRPGAMRSAR